MRRSVWVEGGVRKRGVEWGVEHDRERGGGN